MPEPEVVIRGERLNVGYRRRAVLRDLSFEIGRGDILGIVGPNGSGKTTLVRTILGLNAPLEGHVVRDPALTVSYMPQRDRLEPILPITALEVVMMGPAARSAPLGHAGRHARDARAALERVGAEALAPRLFRDLSGGQQQRVLLARALAAHADVLVLDEPTAGMDLGGEVAILEFLRDLHRTQGVTILFVTHVLPLVLNFAASIMLIAGQRVLHGAVDRILTEERLSDLYGVPVHLGRVSGQRTLVSGSGQSDV